jgi:hypothetical protein
MSLLLQQSGRSSNWPPVAVYQREIKIWWSSGRRRARPGRRCNLAARSSQTSDWRDLRARGHLTPIIEWSRHNAAVARRLVEEGRRCGRCGFGWLALKAPEPRRPRSPGDFYALGGHHGAAAAAAATKWRKCNEALALFQASSTCPNCGSVTVTSHPALGLNPPGDSLIRLSRKLCSPRQRHRLRRCNSILQYRRRRNLVDVGRTCGPYGDSVRCAGHQRHRRAHVACNRVGECIAGTRDLTTESVGRVAKGTARQNANAECRPSRHRDAHRTSRHVGARSRWSCARERTTTAWTLMHQSVSSMRESFAGSHQVRLASRHSGL